MNKKMIVVIVLAALAFVTAGCSSKTEPKTELGASQIIEKPEETQTTVTTDFIKEYVNAQVFKACTDAENLAKEFLSKVEKDERLLSTMDRELVQIYLITVKETIVSMIDVAEKCISDSTNSQSYDSGTLSALKVLEDKIDSARGLNLW